MVRTTLRRRPRTRARSKSRLRSRVKKVSRKRSRVKMTRKRKSRRSRRRIHRGGAKPGEKRSRNDEMEELYQTYRGIYGELTATGGELDPKSESLISKLLKTCLSRPDNDQSFVIPHSLALIGKKMNVPVKETDTTPGEYIDRVIEHLPLRLTENELTENELTENELNAIKRKLSQVGAEHYPSIVHIKNPVEELPESYPEFTELYASGDDKPVKNARRRIPLPPSQSLPQVQGGE